MTLNARFLDFGYIFVINFYWARPSLAATLTATGHTHTEGPCHLCEEVVMTT